MLVRYHILFSMVVIISTFSLCGCAGYGNFFASYKKDAEPPTAMMVTNFYQHRSPLIRYATATGYNAGVIIASPLLMPGQALLEASGMGEGGIVFFVPYIAVANAGGFCAGASAWALCGWWWPEAPKAPASAAGAAVSPNNDNK